MIRTTLIALLASCVVALAMPSWQAVVVVGLLLLALFAFLVDAWTARLHNAALADLAALKKQADEHAALLRQHGHFLERGAMPTGSPVLSQMRRMP